MHTNQRYLRLDQPAERLVVSTAITSGVGAVIGQNVIHTALFFQKRVNRGHALAVGPQSATGNHGEEYNFSGRTDAIKSQSKEPSGGVEHCCVELISLTPRTA